MSGLYLHIPYCHSKCAYCDFYSIANATTMPRFAEAVTREWEMRRNETDGQPRTIYFGGGTPSALPLDQLTRITAVLPTAGADEVTIEANPEDVTADKVRQWRDLGFNRISMGVQSFCDDELAIIGRRHDSASAAEATEAITEGGISNFSLDLIYGLPGQTLQSWEKSLRMLFSLKPTHFSAYILSYEPRTRLWKMRESGQVTEASDSLILDMYQMLCTEARSHGYEHYEISNFALPGFHSRHNSSYWNSTPYTGLGPGAHSFDGLVRRINPSDVREYISTIQSGNLPFIIDEESDDSRFNDILITRLRTAAGLDLATVDPTRLATLMADAHESLENGQLIINDNRMTIPESHWPVADSILTPLMQI